MKKNKELAVKTKKSSTSDATWKAELALRPAVNAAGVIESYQANIAGKDVDVNALVDGLNASFSTVRDGDLSHLESMLIGQATALQTIFTSLARRAQAQEYQRNLEAFLGLALKAQAQSRATIQAIVELKYPRQVAFVKQANISHGPQQVNNGQGFGTSARTRTHAEENKPEQSKLLEDHSHERTNLDAGATTTANVIGGPTLIDKGPP